MVNLRIIKKSDVAIEKPLKTQLLYSPIKSKAIVYL